MGPTWVLSAPDGPHEPCYQGLDEGFDKVPAEINVIAVLHAVLDCVLWDCGRSDSIFWPLENVNNYQCIISNHIPDIMKTSREIILRKLPKDAFDD